MLKSHSHTLTLSLSLSLIHSLIQALLTCWITFVFMSILKSHCFYVKMPMVFWDLIILHHTLSCEFRVHRAGSQLKMPERQTKAGNQDFCKTCSKATLTLFQSLIHSLLTCWTTFVFISMLKSHSHTLTLSRSHSHTHSLSHSHTLSISHSITLDMLNKFCFHV